MIRSFSCVALVLVLAGCGTMFGQKMSTVMADCEGHSPFPAYAKCVESTYQERGKSPNMPAVRAFLAELRSLSEDYTAGKLTDAKAMALANQAYMQTVEASNDRIRARAASSAPVTCNRVGQTVNCY